MPARGCALQGRGDALHTSRGRSDIPGVFGGVRWLLCFLPKLLLLPGGRRLLLLRLAVLVGLVLPRWGLQAWLLLLFGPGLQGLLLLLLLQQLVLQALLLLLLLQQQLVLQAWLLLLRRRWLQTLLLGWKGRAWGLALPRRLELL